MEWKAHAIARRGQLRSARSFLFARNRRILRGALAAWRDGRRGRADAARALSRLVRASETAMLRAGLRRWMASARDMEREEAVSCGTGGE